MPGGRPPKPTLIAKIDGDTRKRGANKHAAHLAGACITQRGIPDCPDFTPPAGASKAVKRRLEVAERHWQYLAGELSREGLLSTADEGMLTQAAQVYSMAWEAFLQGDFGAHAQYSKTYMQCADRMGLNESARAKFPKKDQAMDDLEAALCS